MQTLKKIIMKTIFKLRILFAIIFIQFITLTASAQKTGNGIITGKTYDLPSFTGIEAGGAIKVILIQAPEQHVYFETDENLFSEISIEVKNGILQFTTRGIRKASKLTATVSSPIINLIDVSGASEITSENTLSGSNLELRASGASRIVLDINFDNTTTRLSGASRATLSGTSTAHDASLSGASKLIANNLVTDVTQIEGSGASDAYIFAKEHITSEMTGASKLRYDQAPTSMESKSDQQVRIEKVHGSSHSDTVNVNVGNVKVRVIDGDSTVVVVGNRRLVVDEKGNVNMTRKKEHKFNGHWAGVELGINGLLTPDFDLNYDNNLQFLDQRMEKSIAVNINFYEQNIPLNKSGNVGLVSGLGLTWNNYRFADNVMVRSENNQFVGYYMDMVNVRKSKLTNAYLTLPLYLEFQTKSVKTKEKAHIAAGVVAGWRFSSHTKIYFEEANKEYRLRDSQNVLVPDIMRTPSNTNRNIVKDFDSFQQQPFKLDASVRVGWGFVNLYANYGITSLFIKDRGPELYPFAVGIMVSGW